MSTAPAPVPVDLHSLYYRMGEIQAQNAAIIRRLDDGSHRFGEMARQIDSMDERVAKRLLVLDIARAETEATAKDVVKLTAIVDKLNIVEAKRTGILVAIGAMCSLLGGAFALITPHLFDKFGGK